GGMGAVHEAIDERLDTVVALKETFFVDEKLRKQFEREARLLARLHHQALPRVSDHFNEGDGQFLVMQYIAGEDLFELLNARNAPFPEDEVARWGDQLCDALDYLHTQDPQIIHRDIKPQNLKLTARGQIVLLDFGLAKGSVGPLTAVTTSASIFGYTPNYAPLEQIQGKGTDPRSDIYALGATLYHLVTNIKPPDALSRAGAVVNGQPDPLPLANQIRSDASAGLSNVLDKAMSQKRDDRFTTATAMRDALRAGESGMGEETLITPGTVAYAAARTVSSERATRLVGDQTQRMSLPSHSSEAQTLVAGEATNVRTVTGVQAALAQAPARTNWRPIAAAVVVLILLAGGAAGFFAYRRRQSQPAVTPTVQTESQPVQSSQPNNTSAQSTESTQSVDTARTTQEKTDKTRTETQRSAAKKPDSKDEQQSNLPPPETFDPAHQAQDPNRSRDRSPMPGQQPRPPFDPNRPPPQDRRPPPGTMPDIRVLPNGGRLIRNPDGTTVFVGPKGKTRVVTPGERSNRNRNENHP
ncbi:MAG TPA: serine/threonine-protein kinase, partial [Pyrinomonadaceae bacterium]